MHNEVITIDKSISPNCGTDEDEIGENKDAVDETKDAGDETKDAVNEDKDSFDDNMDIDEEEIDDSPDVQITIMHNKDKYVLSMPLLSTISELKGKLVDIIGVPSKMQKIMIKGLAKDDQTLKSLNVSSSSKIMVVGSKIKDVVAVTLTKAIMVCVTIFVIVFNTG